VENSDHPSDECLNFARDLRRPALLHRQPAAAFFDDASGPLTQTFPTAAIWTISSYREL